MTVTDIEIHVEEQSMATFLEGLLPKLLPERYVVHENCRIVAYNGKHDLRKNLPVVLNSFRHRTIVPKLMILHDQDSADCRVLKNDLVSLINAINPGVQHLVRIVCRELENWYLGDMIAIEQVYPESKASKLANKSKFRNPDNVHGSKELENLSKNFTKMGCAREISKIIDLDGNRSVSFKHFRSGLLRLLS